MENDIRLNEEGLSGKRKVLTFQVCQDLFATEVMVIKEIIEYDNVTRVPMVPEYIRGVINLRGRVLPVIDLAVRLDKTASPITRRSCIIIIELEIEDEIMDVGLMVDAVREVLDIGEEEISPPPSFGSDIRPEFISGLGRVQKKLINLLNLDTVLAIDQLAMFSTEMQGLGAQLLIGTGTEAEHVHA